MEINDTTLTPMSVSVGNDHCHYITRMAVLREKNDEVQHFYLYFVLFKSFSYPYYCHIVWIFSFCIHTCSSKRFYITPHLGVGQYPSKIAPVFCQQHCQK